MLSGRTLRLYRRFKYKYSYEPYYSGHVGVMHIHMQAHCLQLGHRGHRNNRRKAIEKSVRDLTFFLPPIAYGIKENAVYCCVVLKRLFFYFAMHPIKNNPHVKLTGRIVDCLNVELHCKTKYNTHRNEEDLERFYYTHVMVLWS